MNDYKDDNAVNMGERIMKMLRADIARNREIIAEYTMRNKGLEDALGRVEHEVAKRQQSLDRIAKLAAANEQKEP